MKLSRLLTFRPIHYRKQFIRVQSVTFCRKTHNLSAKDDEVKCPMKLSTLYVPGRYGADMYQIVRPVISVDDISRNLDDIRKSSHLRGIDVNLENIVDLLRRLELERSEFTSFVEKDRQYIEEVKHLYSVGDASQLSSLKKKHEDFIEELKSAKEKLHDAEELVLPVVKKIPNLIHPLTPLQSDIIEECGPQHTRQDFDPASHVEICKQTSSLKFSQNGAKSYYLKGVLSELELAIQTYFCNKLTESGYGAMSCVDFCKSFLLEAVGSDPFSVEQAIPIKMKVERGQMLHLVGGASFEAFCAYLTNMNVSKASLPTRYFSIGRRYDAANCQRATFDLFTVVQSSNIHCLTLCKDSQSEDEEFEALFDFISACYDDFKIPFRVVNCSPRNLNVAESRRKRLEIWSPASRMYISVAHISGRGNFVSKRLHSTYGVDHNVDGYCHMVEGVAVNIPVLIGCIVENFQKPNQTFQFPHELDFLQRLIED
ncbi:Serine--tRNA synthetase-like protein Slimp [Araneus ventricosus]|uniref:Serine--tRNA synthetase-like protein Slimp n=1 Tax=Araneus ventricosus TaxID=182803 RepID=A0A4Y2L2L8_ARAVE|nr:Serine--tRNA synthetase-like protein Slimp [Araneus ventricosus]